MEVGRVNESSNMSNSNTVLLQNKRLHSEVLHSLWMSNSSPSFHGSASMVKFEDGQGEMITKERPFFQPIDKEETSNEDYDSSCFHQPEKKRRLLPNQVQFLEKSFEVDNKLEPERKVQLAKELGLEPRQIAIWFQNRRARYKNKQLEKDYDVLKASFDKLKADYDTLFKENDNLRNEVNMLRGKMKQSDPISAEKEKDVPKVVCKLEDAKSDVIDSDSPHFTDTNLFLEPADSSNAFEPEPSDEEDNLSRSFLCFPEIGDQIQANSCNLGFQIEDQPCWFWQY